MCIRDRLLRSREVGADLKVEMAALSLRGELMLGCGRLSHGDVIGNYSAWVNCPSRVTCLMVSPYEIRHLVPSIVMGCVWWDTNTACTSESLPRSVCDYLGG